MLSLTPRFDLVKFNLPLDFLPKEISGKYENILNKNPGVFVSPIDYLNESIQGVSIPGIDEVTIEQVQHSTNSINRDSSRINVEPATSLHYTTPTNPLSNIDREIQVQFRLNQGLYNYFMLYETIFYHLCKPIDNPPWPKFIIDILDENGQIVSRLTLIDVYISGMDGLEFTYNRVTRDTETFTVSFKFNNIDFDFYDASIQLQ